MRDAADQAQDVIDLFTKAALAAGKAVPGLQPSGTCHNPMCELEIPKAQLFCNIQCSQEYEQQQKIWKQTGRRS